MAEVSQAESLLSEILATDTTRRLQAGTALQAYLSEEENSVYDFDEQDRLLAGLVTWVNSSHPKVLQSWQILPLASSVSAFYIFCAWPMS